MKLINNYMLQKETSSSILNHWVLAISCLLLCMSGAGIWLMPNHQKVMV